jgi:hypothetical protein
MATLKTLNKAATSVLNQLVSGVEVGESKTIENSGGAFMAVVVDHLDENLYSVGHYFEQEGDRMSDPDITFFRQEDGSWLPVNCTQSPVGLYTEAVLFENGKISGYHVRNLSELVSFSNLWMKNISHQQGKNLTGKLRSNAN